MLEISEKYALIFSLYILKNINFTFQIILRNLLFLIGYIEAML